MGAFPIANFSGARATLIGLAARTHVPLARYLVRRGARVVITERKTREELVTELRLLGDLPVDLHLGGHRDDDIADADIVFLSPGVPRDLPLVATAQQRGIPISSEIELVVARCRAPIIGITGSAGKTTTTTLVGEMLRTDGRVVYVGGNIGVSLVEQLDEIPPQSWVILELSSYQLEGLRESPSIGAILNVTPNHLDRHPSFEHYRESKLNLLRYQRPSDVAVLGADDPVAASLAPRCPGSVKWFSNCSPVAEGAFRRGDDLVLHHGGVESTFASAPSLKLPGDHNVLNVLAAATLAAAAGVDTAALAQVATSFTGVEHRLEYVRTLDGVSYYNDSIATAPERTLAALRSFSCPIVLIAGGRSKHLPMEELARTTVEKARAVVAFGEMADEVEEAIRAEGAGVAVERASTMMSAVERARHLAQPGDVVLLSPAGTSFDQFRDFEDRGRQFKALIQALEASAS